MRFVPSLRLSSAVIVLLAAVRAPTAPDGDAHVVVTTPSLRLPPLESVAVSSLPVKVEGFVRVPEQHTLLARYDFSLPSRYRLGIERHEPGQHASILQRMYHYHSQELEHQRVPRPMEPDFPRIPDFQLEGEDWGPVRERAFASQDEMRQNAWLLNGKQIIMLNNAQHRIRSLTTQQLASSSEDPIEAKVLRSRLDSFLKRAHADPHNTKTFPDVLREAIVQTRAEQAQYLELRGDGHSYQPFWSVEFPFLAHNEVDLAHYLLRY